MEFPHLSDTEFPIIDTVDVYSFKNEFDYTRWIPNTDITLCSVLWDRDYNDVVKFDSNELRDAYFNSMGNAYKVTLETDARIVPEGYVKLPIPYDVMARYNYLYVDLPIATSATQMIDYENANGVRRWYFFIDNIRYMAPNTTEVFLTLDVWTNFINDMRFKYAMLERGHAPLSVTDTDRFLADPINNSEYLLENDVNFGVPNIVKNTRMIPVGNGTKYLCFAMTAPVDGLDFGNIYPDDSYEYDRPLVYANEATRSGYQERVDNFGVGDGNSYQNLKTPVRAGINSSDNTIPNSLSCIAVRASDCIGENNFLRYMSENRPTFFNAVQCCFMVGADMVFLRTLTTINGYQIYEAQNTGHVFDGIELTKEMFGYDEKYERFAKLYTSPYASIEISDDSGKTATIEIETISPFNKVHADFSVAFPFLNARVFLTGIGYYGVDQARYDWRKMDDELLNVDTPNSEWAKYLFEFDIPTYALFMNGQTAWNMRNWRRGAEGARLAALTAYQTGVRDANTAYENALADHATAHKNAVNLAKTVHINTNNSALLNRTGSEYSISVQSTNTDNNAKLADANTAVQNVTNAANIESAQYVNVDNTVFSVNSANYNNTTQNDLIDQTKTTQVQAQTAMSLNNAASSGIGSTIAGVGSALATAGMVLATSGVGTALGAMAIGGASIASGASALSASLNWNAANDNAMTVVGANENNVTDLRRANNRNATTARSLAAYTQTNINNSQALQANNSMLSGSIITDNNITASVTNMTNGVNAATAIKESTYNIETKNGDNLRNVSTTNADNTKSNADANSGYTRGIAIENLKQTLETSQTIAQASMRDAANQEPVRFSQYSGDMSGDVYMNRGVRIRLKTQTKDAIARTGDYFARYGYAVNRIWDVEESGLNIMNHFTYWKFSDIWVDDIQASSSLTQSAIHDILMRGTTVWSDPDEIGRIEVYEN